MSNESRTSAAKSRRWVVSTTFVGLAIGFSVGCVLTLVAWVVTGLSVLLDVALVDLVVATLCAALATAAAHE